LFALSTEFAVFPMKEPAFLMNFPNDIFILCEDKN
jgi:hypothetical protein